MYYIMFITFLATSKKCIKTFVEFGTHIGHVVLVFWLDYTLYICNIISLKKKLHYMYLLNEFFICVLSEWLWLNVYIFDNLIIRVT